MGKTRFLAVIVALLIVAILAVLLLPGDEPRQESSEAHEAMVTVIAAKADIPAFTVITEEMVYPKEVPESSVHINDVKSTEQLVGYRSLVTIACDEVIMLNHIIAPDAPENRLSHKIENGVRAMAVPVDDTSGICNQIRVGDFVDVVVAVQNVEKTDEEGQSSNQEQSSAAGKNSSRIVSVTVLQNIRVLALDQNTLYAPQQEGGIYYYREVTLAVTPEQAVKLGWAQYEGKIYLTLRGENDNAIADTEDYSAVRALTEEG